MASPMKFVTVLVPCRNEADYIQACLDSIIAGDYPHALMEVLVIDGMSQDGTRPILREYSMRYSFVRMVDNERQTTPCALNVGIREAKGAFIVRMDAHATYCPDYISKLVSFLLSTGADNVGGVRISVPGRRGVVAASIACAVSHPFGVGSSLYTSTLSKPRWVDTVWGGCYRREVFDKIGLFDEQFVRNQDDEFNHRLIINGGKVLLVPEVRAYYYARTSLAKLWRTYYQYGYFKPLTAYKLMRILTFRQLIPSVFLVGLLAVVILGLLAPAFWGLTQGVVAAYAAANLIVAVSMIRQYGWAPSLFSVLVFPIIHAAYGTGFLHGCWDIWVFRRHGGLDGRAVPLSR